MEYETQNRHYAHVDCPGHADYVKVSRCHIVMVFFKVLAFSFLRVILSFFFHRFFCRSASQSLLMYKDLI